MTVFSFAPSATQAFQFQPTLDGDVYTCVVKWNLFGQRWYLNCFAANGSRVFTVAMVGSPPDYDISLCGGYFQSSLVFRTATQTFEVSP